MSSEVTAAPPQESGGSFQPAVLPRQENPSQAGGGAPATATVAPAPATVEAPTAVAVGSPAPVSMAMPVFKKKRGRPRKYGPDGSLVMPLSLMPISASAPAGEFSLSSVPALLMKRGRGRPGGSASRQQQQQQWGLEIDSFGNNKHLHTQPNSHPFQ